VKWLVSFVVALTLWASPASAQLATTVETGRMFNVGAGSFVTASSTSLEWSVGRLSTSGVVYLSRSGIFEKDLSASVSLVDGKKWTVSSYVGTYWYTGIGRDWSWSVSVRRVIR